MTNTVWTYTPPGQEAEKISRALGLSREIAQILINRGIRTAESAHDFLHGTLDDLLDPFLMTGMETAVQRILQAVDRQEKILIFGDYDVDGILSIVALSKALTTLGLHVDYFIPERLKKGYGIKPEYLQIVLDKGASLVVSVDCGMRAVEFVSQAKQQGIDVIITDHHQPGPDIPEALVVLNPVLDQANYPDKRLAGIGVVFKLIQALFIKKEKTTTLPHYLKLVSIATIADVVALRGENRLFVKFGLKGLEEARNPGLLSLLKASGLKGRPVNVGDVGFRLGPRINAAGRLGMADMAVELFSVQSSERAKILAQKLNKMNSQRQKIEERIFQQAMSQIKKRSLDKKYRFLILGCREWHRGVIGIVASKLKEAYYRPVLLFAYEDGRAFGSGRSIPDFSLIDCLDQSHKHLLNYGGHTLAVGCELEREKMDVFKASVNSYTFAHITDDILRKKIKIDAKVDFAVINRSFLESLFLLSPFGAGNPKPVLMSENVRLAAAPKKLQGKHSKLILEQGGRFFEALGWGKPQWADSFGKEDIVNLCFSLQSSEYMGEQRLSLNVIDILPACSR